MSKRIRYTISLLPSDTDIMDHLESVKKHTTISMYIRNLIKRDLNSSYHETKDIEKLVEMVIERIKESGELRQNVSSSKVKKQPITDEQRDIIMSLF